MIEDIESKFISVCLNNDYSLIADLHIFVYVHAEFSSISLECTKVKLLIFDNLGSNNVPSVPSSIIFPSQQIIDKQQT